MSICYGIGNLGLAVFDAATQKLYVTQVPEECQGRAAFETLSQTIETVNPRRVFISSRCHEGLQQQLRTWESHRQNAWHRLHNLADSASQLFRASTEEAAEPSESSWVTVQLASSFQLNKAASKVLKLLTPDTPCACLTDALAHRAWISSLINPAAEQQICAAGGLLTALLQAGVLEEDSSGQIHVQGIEELKLPRLMRIDGPSLRALHIFHADCQPSLMGIGTSKEGFSLFTLMDNTVTAPGRKRLRQWFARPIMSISEVNERLDAVEFFAWHRDVRAHLKGLLKQVGDPGMALKKCLACVGCPAIEDLRKMRHCLLSLQHLSHAMAKLNAACLPGTDHGARSEDPSGSRACLQGRSAGGRSTGSDAMDVLSDGRPVEAPASSSADGDGRPCGRTFCSLPVSHIFPHDCNDSLQKGAFLLESVFDVDQASVIGVVKCGLDFGEELDDLKATFVNMHDLLESVADAEVRKIPAWLNHMYPHIRLSCHYSPHAACFLMFSAGGPLPADVLEDCFSDYEEWGHDIGTAGDEGVFYRSAITAELDAEVGDVKGKIRDLEDSIAKQVMLRLSNMVSSHLSDIQDGLAMLDALLSLAEASELHRLTRPELCEENVLDIKDGWHPLSAALVDAFIPNDTRMSDVQHRIQVITGPNCSGKSVYAKQVALIVFLAHVGSFVPAVRARVGVTDAILTCMGYNGANGQLDESSFAADLCHLSAALNNSGPRSLLILDEFGKGTLPADGKALLLASISSLSLQPCPPRVVCTTHFMEVLDPSLLPRNLHIALLSMDTFVPETQPADAQGARDITFLFKLKPGAAVPSFGLQCAARAQAAPRVVERMWQIQSCLAARRHCPCPCVVKHKVHAYVSVARLVHALDPADHATACSIACQLGVRLQESDACIDARPVSCHQ